MLYMKFSLGSCSICWSDHLYALDGELYQMDDFGNAVELSIDSIYKLANFLYIK